LLAAIRDPNPLVFLESKYLYRSLRGPVPLSDAALPLGAARLARVGEHLSIITYGPMLGEALEAARQLEQAGHSVEVLDLRTLAPLDQQAILASARKTGKVLIVHEAHLTCGVGAEVAALIGQQAFEYLDGPVTRLAAPDVPIPYSPPLEDAYRPNAATILAAAQELLAY
jgi:2-oxoisovalerate dehydrogenase E1 component beta subunit